MTRSSQVLRGLLATLTSLLVVFGLPVALIHYVGWPLPSRLPSIDEIGLSLRSGIDINLLIKTLAVIVWICWSLFVYALAVETVAYLRGRAAERIRVPRAFQASAARLVATAALLVSTLAPIRPPLALAEPVPAVTTVVQAETHHQGERTPSDSVVSFERRTEPNRYVVQPLDTLWSIAEGVLGDGTRWREIRDLNLGLQASDGTSITSTTDHVHPGIELQLPAPSAQARQHQLGTHVVQRGDNQWKIARQALIDEWGRTPTSSEVAPYWREVIEANRENLVQPGNPDLIRPGQTWLLPPIPEPTQAPGRHEVSDQVIVQRGDSFWTIAQRALSDTLNRDPSSSELRTYWRELIEANTDNLADPDNPDLIYPGQTLTVVVPSFLLAGDLDTSEGPPEESDAQPDADLSSEVDTEPEAIPETPPTETEPEVPEEPSEASPEPGLPEGEAPIDAETSQPAEDSGETESAEGGLPVGRLAGLGIIAAGLVALLRRLRRVQLQHRPLGGVPTPPPEGTITVETDLRTAAAMDTVEFAELALRALAQQTSRESDRPPTIVGARISDEGVEVLLWDPSTNAPGPWHANENGTSWSLPRTTDTTHLGLVADGSARPFPALVTIGHNESHQLLMDLEFLGAAQIIGDPTDVQATCYTMATELAASPFADHLEVVCVGFGQDLDILERVRYIEQVDDALLAEVEEKVGASLEFQVAYPIDPRSIPGGDILHPMVILDPTSTPPEGAQRLLGAAQVGGSVAAVVGYPTGDRWKLKVTGGSIVVEPIDVELSRRNLTPTEQKGVNDLVIAAKDHDGILDSINVPAALNGSTVDAHAPTQPSIFATTVDADPTLPADDLDVRVLGPIRIEGLTNQFPSRKAAELPVLLVFHRDGMESDAIMEALWPGEPPNNSRLHVIAARARSTLGNRSDGTPYLPRVDTQGNYWVSPHLGSDVERFSAILERADENPEDDQATLLESALNLVTGEPFSGAGNGYAWAWADNLVNYAVIAVDNTAHRLARIALEQDKPDLAEWAGRHGTLSTPTCEECYRNLMRAAVAAGNQTALRTVFEQLVTVMERDDGPDAMSYLEPETIEYYERHSRRAIPRRA